MPLMNAPVLAVRWALISMAASVTVRPQKISATPLRHILLVYICRAPSGPAVVTPHQLC